MLDEIKALEPQLKQIVYGCVEHVQATKAALYLSASHDLNDKTFEMALIVGERELSRGRGKSKKEAEQRAAAEGLSRLDAEEKSAATGTEEASPPVEGRMRSATSTVMPETRPSRSR